MSQSCSNRKTVGSKHLSENNLDVDCTVYIVSKYLCVDMAKNTLCWFRTIGQNQIIVPDLRSTLFSLPSSIFSPSLPNPQYLVLSFCAFCLTPRYVLPALIPHKKRMMFEYDYHWLIDNKHLRTHLLFHLALEYNT